ncbi:MAG: 16S rRNA (adenine1518-N6/adenine1519-N6)-dimethyltransferase [Phenylobacterium sp.]|jgi:16S rRNA (adenine1518-N6/adenine1519-N6)-dimethyltransferase
MNQKVTQGHRAKKRFGQNFLNDEIIISQIVRAINPQPDDSLVEIGPGLGAITEPVASLANQLTVVELDRDLVKRLEHHPEFADKLTVIEADALKFDFASVAQPGKKMKIFGNLPYNISTPLLFHLFEYTELIDNMHFMLQQEVVKRMVAEPGSKAFGRLTVMTQYFCDAVPVVSVPPESFSPPPKVESMVIRLTPKPPSKRTVKNIKDLNRVCLEAFNQRRKTLRNCLKNIIPVTTIEALGIDPTLRPEYLTLENFITLANWLTDNPTGES